MTSQQHKLLNPNDISLFDDMENVEEPLSFLDEIGSNLTNIQPKEPLFNEYRPPTFENKPFVSDPPRPPTQQRINPHKKIMYAVRKNGSYASSLNSTKRNLTESTSLPKQFSNFSTSNGYELNVINRVKQSEDDLAASNLHWDDEFPQPVRTTQAAVYDTGFDHLTYSRPPTMEIKPSRTENKSFRTTQPRLYTKTTWTYKEMCLLAVINSDLPNLLCDQIYMFLELHFSKRLNKVPNGEIRQKSSYKNSVRHCLNDVLFYKVEGNNPKQTRYGLNMEKLERSIRDCRNNFEQRRTEFLADLTYPDLYESMFRGELKNLIPTSSNAPRVLYPVRRLNVQNNSQLINSNNHRVSNNTIHTQNSMSYSIKGGVGLKRSSNHMNNENFLGPPTKIIQIRREPTQVVNTSMPTSNTRIEVENTFPQPTLNTLYWNAAQERNSRPPTYSPHCLETDVQTHQTDYHFQENQTTQGDSLGGSPTSTNSIYSDGDIGELSEFFQIFPN